MILEGTNWAASRLHFVPSLSTQTATRAGTEWSVGSSRLQSSAGYAGAIALLGHFPECHMNEISPLNVERGGKRSPGGQRSELDRSH